MRRRMSITRFRNRVKCKFIADEVDLTPSQVGTYLSKIRDTDTSFEVEPWSYSNATTWRVRPPD